MSHGVYMFYPYNGSIRIMHPLEETALQQRHKTFTILLACTSLLASPLALGCAACDHTVSRDWETQGISHKEGFVADLSYGYMNQDQQRYGTGAASTAAINRQLNAGQEVEAYTKTQTLNASLTYNAEDWGASLHLPYVKRTHGTYGNTAPLGSTFMTSADSSLGDIKLTGRYSGFSADGGSGIIGGIKLPTGNTRATFSDGVTPLDAGLQIGTGSTDLILGGYTTATLADNYGWFLQGMVQHAIATKQALGNLDYHPGDAYALNTGIRYAKFGTAFSPMLQLNIIKRQADSGTPNAAGLSSVPADPLTGKPVSGGTLIYLSPGFNVRIGGGASVYGFVQLPIYQNVNSLQITPKYTLTLGMRQSFE